MPSSVKWQQIKTEHFKIIYPKGIDSVAQLIANNLEALYLPDSKDIGGESKWRVPLVINNLTSISNGYSRIMPRKMHWYLMPYPSSFLGINSWHSTLAIHEYRHIAQFKAFDKNSIRIYNFLYGQLGWGLGLGIAVPQWWLEGDAVFHETIFSKSGRGRSAFFAMPVKAIDFTYPKKKLNYYRFYYRSYKTFYPNWYYLGYYMVTYFNRTYGAENWRKVIQSASRYPVFPSSLNLGLWLNYRMSFRKLFDSTFRDLKTYWSERYDSTEQTSITYLKHLKKRTYTNYIAPFKTSKGLLVLKNSFDQNTTLEILSPSGKEHFVREIPSYRISAAKNLVTWPEVRVDARWNDVYYTKIALFDLDKEKLKYLPVKGKLQSPRLSDDAVLLAFVQYDKKIRPSIEIYNTKTLQKVRNIKLHQFEAVRQPSFSSDKSKIVFTGTNPSRGIGIFTVDLKSGKVDTVLNFSWTSSIDKPIFWKNYVIFQADISGLNNLYAIDTSSKQIYRLTYRPYGVGYQFATNSSDTLYLSDYTSDGWEVGFIKLSPQKWTKVDFSKARRQDYFVSDKTKNLLHDYTNPDSLPHKHYKSTKYKHLAHWINPHSWLWGIMPNLDDGTIDNAYFMLLSNDYLDEASWSIMSNFDANNVLTNTLNLRISRFFPVIDIFGQNQYDLSDAEFRNYSLGAQLSLPLDFSRDIWTRKFDFSLSSSVAHTKSQNVNGYYPLAGVSLNMKNAKYQAYRDVDSRLAQAFVFSYTRLLNSSSNQLTVGFRANFPGLLRHSVVSVAGAFQKIDGNYPFTKNVSIARGYKTVPYKQIYKVSVTDHLPLFYPDCGIKSVFFIKRVRAKLFYDYSLIDKKYYRSVGGQLLWDFDLFGYPFDLSSGIQAAYLIDSHTWNFAPVLLDLSINF